MTERFDKDALSGQQMSSDGIFVRNDFLQSLFTLNVGFATAAAGPMKRILLSAIFIGLSFTAAEARYGYRGFYPPQIPIVMSPYGGDIFGASQSGVAPSTAVPEGRSTYVVPVSHGSHTGGVND